MAETIALYTISPGESLQHGDGGASRLMQVNLIGNYPVGIHDPREVSFVGYARTVPAVFESKRLITTPSVQPLLEQGAVELSVPVHAVVSGLDAGNVVIFLYSEQADPQRLSKMLTALIRERRSMQVDNDVYHLRARWSPDFMTHPTIETLFLMHSLWITVDGHNYIPDELVKTCVERIDGKVVSQRNWSVFWAMRKDSVYARWGMLPKAASPKQQFQLWDEEYARAMLASIQLDRNSQSRSRSKIKYKLRDHIFDFELLKCKRNWDTRFLRTMSKKKILYDFPFDR